MKKLILFVTAVALGLGTVACSSDDNSSNSYKDDIQGEWKEEIIRYLDKSKKVIEDEVDDNDGCGTDEVEFKGDKAIVTYYSKNYITKLCESDKEERTFEINGETISVILTEEGETIRQSSRIVTLTKTKLVIETKQDIEQEDPSDVFYVQVEYRRK